LLPLRGLLPGRLREQELKNPGQKVGFPSLGP